MKKFWNFIQNEDTSETELLFNGPISEDTWWGDEATHHEADMSRLIIPEDGETVVL